jgi:sulfur relay (sulfurtransferase) DsrC/TusE family protein
MKIELDLTEHQIDILQQFRKLYAEHQQTPASASALKHQRLQSGLTTCAQILAEAVDKAAKAQGV